MNNDRSSGGRSEPVAAASGNAWTLFWFAAIPPTGLRVLRVLSGLLFCAWILSFLGHERAFFSLNGWIDAAAYQELQLRPNLAPAPIGWSILYLAGEDAAAFQTIYWLSVTTLVLFTLGVATRVTGVLTWVVVVSFLANPAISYEGDYLLGILAFYLAIGYLLTGQWNGNLTPLERLLGARQDFVLAPWLFARAAAEPTLSCGANFTMRLLQIHFVIIMTTSALHHLQIAEWWSGVAFWFPLHPPLQTTPESLRDAIARPYFTLFWLSLTQYIALAWQLTFPFFAWRPGRAWRILLLGGAAIYWLGVFFLFQLPLFGPFVFLCALSYLRPEEWAWLRAKGTSLFSAETKKNAAPPPKKMALAGKENIKK